MSARTGAGSRRTEAGLRLALTPGGKLFFYTVLVAYAVLTLLPFLWSLSLSLQTAQDAANVHLLPPHATLQNYAYIFRNAPFARWFLNSLLVAGSVTLLSLFFNSLGGYALARLRFPGREAVFLFVLATMMIPGIITLVPDYLLLSRLRWIDSYWALTVPFAATSFGTFWMRQYFLSLPHELEEAARIDGLSRLGIFWRIALPLARPALATQALLTFMGQWNSFMWPFVMTNSEDMFTLTVGLQSFHTQYYVFWNDVMAASMLATLPIVVLYVALQRYFVRGIATTGLK
ncbi:MAG: carbohydrate ABC transporter permease [Bacillota bacterium]|nr:carbohydrate ABC transporter permease [Bacillota bacterium]